LILKIITYLCTLKLLILFINIMNSYETVFILTPVLSDDQAKEAVQKFESEIANFGGKLKHSEKWGLKKLAYPIQKKTTGFYFLLEYEGEGDLIANLEVSFKRDERVMRFLTVKMDVNHLAYAEKRRAKMGEAKTAKAEA
jgi:small subunit ribosomal protein S6